MPCGFLLPIFPLTARFPVSRKTCMENSAFRSTPFEILYVVKEQFSERQGTRARGDSPRAGAQDVLPRAQELHRDHAVPGVPQADKHGELSNAELRARRGSLVLAPEKVRKAFTSLERDRRERDAHARRPFF